MVASNAHPAVWTRTDTDQGLGLGALFAEPDGFRLEASETVADGGDRFSCRFTVHTDLAWVTRTARAEALSGDGVLEMELELSGKGGHWTVDGRRAPQLDGCTDVDVAATPLTNTLPIRRLGLRPGEFRDITVAWVDVPNLRVHRMTQRYTRLPANAGTDRYEYRDPTYGSFELTVDRDGLVLDYEGLARRVR